MLVLSFGERFLLNAPPWRRRMWIYIFIFTVAIPVNCTSEVRGLFETIAYIYFGASVKVNFISPKGPRDFLIKLQDGAEFSENRSAS